MWDDLKLRWDGQWHTIPGDRVVPAFALTERFMTMDEMMSFLVRGGTPYFTLACVYATLLRYTGCNVTDAQVAIRMFGPNNMQGDAATVIQYLVERMRPKDVDLGAATPGNAPADERPSSAPSMAL